MTRTTQVKDPKPKVEQKFKSANDPLGGFKGIVINASVTIVIMTIFSIGIYTAIVKAVIVSSDNNTPAIEKNMQTFPYDMEEFIVNLIDPIGNKYLKVAVSLDVQKNENDPEIGIPDLKGKNQNVHGNNSYISTEEYYKEIMKPYKMKIRDIIIDKMSSMSSVELKYSYGKNQAKEAIKDELNILLPEDRQVFSINFGEFIIQ